LSEKRYAWGSESGLQSDPVQRLTSSFGTRRASVDVDYPRPSRAGRPRAKSLWDDLERKSPYKFESSSLQQRGMRTRDLKPDRRHLPGVLLKPIAHGALPVRKSMINPTKIYWTHGLELDRLDKQVWDRYAPRYRRVSETMTVSRWSSQAIAKLSTSSADEAMPRVKTEAAPVERPRCCERYAASPSAVLSAPTNQRFPTRQPK
jgi:hypothetical protein